MSNFNLIQSLPAGSFDIIGDIHGEYDVLLSLLQQLGYDRQGNHPEGRFLVFVGDLCDRGLDSPAVINLVAALVEKNRAYAILGNHEINLLAGEVKDGSGWFFDKQYNHDYPKYGDYHRVSEVVKNQIISFFNTLPIALVRDDIRIIHAAWIPEYIKQLQGLVFDSVLSAYLYFEAKVKQDVRLQAWYADFLVEKDLYYQHYKNKEFVMTTKKAIQQYDLFCNRVNLIRILTSGLETEADIPFYIAGRWRFTNRVRWWDYYLDSIPVVIGHYWRMFAVANELFYEDPTAWLGPLKNVFCVDYSIGLLWKDRRNGIYDYKRSKFRLAALRWPEKLLVLNTGEIYPTI